LPDGLSENLPDGLFCRSHGAAGLGSARIACRMGLGPSKPIMGNCDEAVRIGEGVKS